MTTVNKSGMNIIRCENLSLSYDRREVIRDLNMEVEEGSYLCVLGENGAGKSTLVKGLLQLKKPSSGNIIYAEGIRQSDIGYLPQQSEAQKDFPASVHEIVLSGCLNRLGFRFFYGSREKKMAEKYMNMLGIYELSNQVYRELSGGQQQRVLLARALCSGAKLLVLDEPVAGLDPLMTKELYALIETLNKEYKMTVIMVSHDVTYAVKYASHILHLEQDRYYFGTVEDYLSSKVSETFLREERLSCD